MVFAAEGRSSAASDLRSGSRERGEGTGDRGVELYFNNVN